jgi:hypothetical protein
VVQILGVLVQEFSLLKAVKLVVEEKMAAFRSVFLHEEEDEEKMIASYLQVYFQKKEVEMILFE